MRGTSSSSGPVWFVSVQRLLAGLLLTGFITVAQVYSEWCGKCECIEGTLKRIKAEKDDAPVEFVLLEASKFDFLKEYRNRSKPYFAFYKQGELIESVEGVDGPKILQLLDQCLPSKQEYEEALAELNKK
mmetsp:Transcript_42357/g.108998  ORF Transcript_42357/g.108998 Transcript_42357/m.108998 type:complete len:130 (-) Transcript_42357:147-536(-)